MIRSVVAVLILGTLTGACAVAVAPPLSPEQRAEYRIVKVVVDVPATDGLWWGAGERAVVAASGRDDGTAEAAAGFLETPEGSAALTAYAEARLEPPITAAMRPALSGSKPMQVSVVIDSVFVASTAQQLIVAGNHVIGGGIQLFDLETGQALSQPQRISTIESGGGGVIGVIVEAASRDPIIRLGERFGQLAAQWIQASEPMMLGVGDNPPPLPALPRPEPSAPKADPAAQGQETDVSG